MNVEVAPYVRREWVPRTEEPSSVTAVTYETRDYGSDIGSFEIRPAQGAKPPRRRGATEKIVRRLLGFLVEDRGVDCKVAFVENGDHFFYYLPARQLRQSGITAPNQPFQMDEMEIELDGGRLMTGYVFCPLAKPSDSFVDSIELNEDRRREFSAIVKKFGKPKG